MLQTQYCPAGDMRVSVVDAGVQFGRSRNATQLQNRGAVATGLVRYHSSGKRIAGDQYLSLKEYVPESCARGAEDIAVHLF